MDKTLPGLFPNLNCPVSVNLSIVATDYWPCLKGVEHDPVVAHLPLYYVRNELFFCPTQLLIVTWLFDIIVIKDTVAFLSAQPSLSIFFYHCITHTHLLICFHIPTSL